MAARPLRVEHCRGREEPWHPLRSSCSAASQSRRCRAETGTDTGKSELERSIGLFQLSMFGIGATIGTGIFFVLSEAVPVAGPAVIWSFVIAGVGRRADRDLLRGAGRCGAGLGVVVLLRLRDARRDAAIGVAACLLLEYGVSAAAVAVGWSQYLNELFDNLFGFTIPEALSQAPEQGGVINLPAVILVVLCTLLLIRGASESAKTNAVMVLIKIGVLVLFIVVGAARAGTPTTCPTSRRSGISWHHLGGRHHLLLLHRPGCRLDRG